MNDIVPRGWKNFQGLALEMIVYGYNREAIFSQYAVAALNYWKNHNFWERII